MLVKLKSSLRDFASRNFVCTLLAEIAIYLIWFVPMFLLALFVKGSEAATAVVVVLTSALGLWLFNGLDERRLKDFPEEMLRLEWFRLN